MSFDKKPLMKCIVTLIVAISFSLGAGATHHAAGYIQYRHVSGLTYEIDIITYTEIGNNNADRPFLSLSIDGNLFSVARKAQVPAINGWTELKKNIYTIEHTFLTGGSHAFSMTDSNRLANLNNIANSVEVKANLSSFLKISLKNQFNSSPRFLIDPFFMAVVGEELKIPLVVTEADGDVLSYRLVPVRRDFNVQDPDYVQPKGMILDEKTGTLRWTPDEVGHFVIGLEITECRDGQIIGTTLADVYLQTTALSPAPPEFRKVNFPPVDGQGRYTIHVAAGDSVNLKLINKSDIDVITDASGSTANVYRINDSSVAEIAWATLQSDLSCTPYFFILTVKNGKVRRSEVISVYVEDSNFQCSMECSVILSTGPEILTERSPVNIFPNPVSGEFTITGLPPDLPPSSTINVIDQLGRTIRIPTVLNGDSLKGNSSGLTPGLYILYLEAGENSQFLGRINVL